jgi:hypothetical protein
MQAIKGTMPYNDVAATPIEYISDPDNDHIGDQLAKVNISGTI